MRIALTAFIMGCISTSVLGQEAKIEGYVLNERDKSVGNVRIVAPGGEAATSDSLGHFVISFSGSVQAGQAMRITIARPNWVIYHPIFGECVAQSAERNFEPLRVIIVPKGSPLALSPKRLNEVIAKWTAEKIKLRAEVGSLKQSVDEYAFLRQYANEYGFTLEQFRNAAEQWAQVKDSDDKEERALKDYWKKNYASAVQLAEESAQAADEELKRANQKTIDVSRKVVRRYKLAGNAYFEQDKFREALASYLEIRKRFETRELSKENLTLEWAETTFLIGDTKRILGERIGGGEGLALLRDAVVEFQQSLSFSPREQIPQGWATTQNSLGIVFKILGERVAGNESINYLKEAVASYRGALDVRTRNEMPKDWAETMNNLGNVLVSLGERLSGPDSMKYMRDAVSSFRAALEVFNREQLPQEWATIQNNLGNALWGLGERASGGDSIRFLNEAVAVLRGALEVRTRDRFPHEWAATQNNLGITLVSLSDRVGGPENITYLKDAVSSHRAALEVFTREELPLDWASSQNNLGNALWSLALLVDEAGGIRYLNDAVSAYRAALEVDTKEHVPQLWAQAQNNLGNAFMSLGELQSGPNSIKYSNDAATAYRAALEIRTREQFPQDWAATKKNLGVALFSLGNGTRGSEGIKYLSDAVEAFRATLEIYDRHQFPQAWVTTQDLLGLTLASLGVRLTGAERIKNLNEAVEAYENAFESDSSEDSYFGLMLLLRDELFKFDKALALQERWVARHPNNVYAQESLAEAQFTAGRFRDCEERINVLLSKADVPLKTKIALRALAIASALADGRANQAPAKLDALIAEVSHLPSDFKVEQSSRGTRYFINEDQRLSPYRVSLGKLFDSLENEDPNTTLKLLNELRTSGFSPK